MAHAFTGDDGTSTVRTATGQTLVFLSTLGPVDAFVLRAVCAAHPDVHLVHLVDADDPGRPGLWRRVRTHPWRSLAGRVRDLVQGPARRRQERRLARALFGPSGQPEPAALGIRTLTEAPKWQVRHPPLRDLLQTLAPARMLVCGAPWLPAGLYETARHGAYNVHWGIAPEYRGGHSIFFALSEGRTDRIGVTIHELTPRIDAGEIVAQGRVAVTAADDEDTLWVKCAQEAARLAATLASLPADAPLETRPQGAGGRSYRYSDRTVRRELAYAVRRRLLGRRPTPSEAVRWPARLAEAGRPRVAASGPDGARTPVA